MSHRNETYTVRCVSTTLTGDTFACARSLHAALCASYTVCKAIDPVVRRVATRSVLSGRRVIMPARVGHKEGPEGSDEDEPGW